MNIKSNSLSDLKNLASQIIKTAGNRRVILFHGEMGAGKTTLIKEICLILGVVETVSSPTFGFVKEYETIKGTVFHFDAYRIEDEEEAFDIGLEEYLYSGNWCLIEWPEKIASFLPNEKQKLEVIIEVNSDKRIYKF